MNVIGRGVGQPPVGAGLVAAVVVALLGVACWAPQAWAGRVVHASARSAAAFWTPARMRRAKPLDARFSARVRRSPKASRTRSEAGRPHVYPSAGASSAETAIADFEAVADPTSPGFRQNGVVFIVTPFGLGRCSGTAVNSPNFSVVFTAAHCIRDPGHRGDWFGFQWVFVPGYRYGQRPFGVFAAKWLDTTRGWRKVGSENYDVGAAVVRRNARGRRLTKAVGGAGIAWGLPAEQVFDIHGYPAARPFDGETQRVCSQRPFLGHDVFSFLSPGPLNLAVNCFVTGGASGGGWTINGGILNSVTAYSYEDNRPTDFGPYFGKEVGRLFARARRVK